MSYKLVIAEKPSVAKSIAAVIGAEERKNNYLEGNGYRVTWCYGHLIRLAKPEEIDPKYKSWERSLLPILPETFPLKIAAGHEEHMKLLTELMNDPETEGIINACDAGREGEAIFRNVYEMAGCEKPVKRLWISSMEDEAIKKGFENLRPGEEYDRLYEAARCRTEADWIVGINATRLFSTIYEEKLNTGRVVSPTLTAIVRREEEINAFQPEPYYIVMLEMDGFTAESDRFKEKAMAMEAVERAKDKATVKEIRKKQERVNPPMLFDLTSLQRDANRWLGFTAQETLEYLQLLYEKKLITYPRTDSRYLSSGMTETARGLFSTILDKKGLAAIEMREQEKIFDDSKVSDHHAILPTAAIKNLDKDELMSGEMKLLDLITERMLFAFSDPYEYEETEVTLECGGYLFTAKTHKTLKLGYKGILKLLHPAEMKKEADFSDMTEGSTLPVKGNRMESRKTKPPKRYTEDTLLCFMENAGDKEMPENAERKGLGTPATRAGIIEKLVNGKFIERSKSKKNSFLSPTRLGKVFATILPETLQSAQMTADWETELEKVRNGELSHEDFRKKVDAYVSELVRDYHRVSGFEELFSWRHESIGPCPRCGEKVVEHPRYFSCMNEDCGFKLWKNSRFFAKKKKKLDAALAKQILTGNPVFLSNCYSEEKDKWYDAIVTMTDNGQETQYTIEFDRKRRA